MDPPSSDRTPASARSFPFPKSIRTLLKWTAAIAAGVAFFIVFMPILFIGANCFSIHGRMTGQSPDIQNVIADVKGYARDESSTYLTLPEWYIVYSTEEYASYIKDNPPSRFPYFGSIRQYWGYYRDICRITKGEYPFDTGVHLMLMVIGASFSAENAVKGLYENSLGRVTEWVSSHDTEEDAFAYKTAREYGTFMHTVPWYEFPFGTKLAGLWRDTPFWGPHVIRKWERRAALSTEYGVKAAYGWIIRRTTQAAYEPEDLEIHVWIDHAPEAIFSDPRVRKVKEMSPRSFIVIIPRYEEFTDIVTKLAEQGVQFHDIAGNDEILLTAIAPSNWEYDLRDGQLVLRKAILTKPDMNRIAVKAPVRSLQSILTALRTRGIRVEHLYDY
jgi:hypothetical protein